MNSFQFLWIFINMQKNQFFHQFFQFFHSLDTVNFTTPSLDWPHLFLNIFSSQNILDKLLIYVSLYQHAKIRLFHWFVLDVWLIKKSCNLISWEHFGPYLKYKNYCRWSKKIINSEKKNINSCKRDPCLWLSKVVKENLSLIQENFKKPLGKFAKHRLN